MGTTSLVTTSLESPTARKLLGDLDAELMGLYPDHPYPPPFGDDEAVGVGSVLIAYDDQRAVGCGAVRRLDDETAELMRMYVLPTARRIGIGKLLLRSLEAEARDLGVTRVVLEAGDRQPDAIAMYEHHGYEAIPTWKDDPNPHSLFLARVLD
ncbi:MAG: GNAT family N-acetyltransferase [Acidimicrobiia bacterium]